MEYTVAEIIEREYCDSEDVVDYIRIDEKGRAAEFAGPADTWVPVVDYNFEKNESGEYILIITVPNNWKEYAKCVRPSNGRRRRKG